MTDQDASSCATEIPCTRRLLNANRYLQADRKPSAPRPACPWENLPTAAHLLCCIHSATQAGAKPSPGLGSSGFHRRKD